MMIWHTLTDEEVKLADDLGREEERQSQAIRSPGAFGASEEPEKSLALHILGARGQQAAASALGGRVITQAGSYDVRDVEVKGKVVGVRTRSSLSYELNIRKGDSAKMAYLLVRTNANGDTVRAAREKTFCIAGWILGKDAKRPEWLKTYGGRTAAYFVPDSALSSPYVLAGIPVPTNEHQEQALKARRYTICPCCGAGMTTESFGGTIIFVCQRGSAGETRCRGRQIAERLAEPSTQALLIEGQRWP